MTTASALEAKVKAIVDANSYMTLATADEQGLPWASPVWCATADCREFLWVSSPQARHSRNIAVRPELAIVIFDSHQRPGRRRQRPSQDHSEAAVSGHWSMLAQASRASSEQRADTAGDNHVRTIGSGRDGLFSRRR